MMSVVVLVWLSFITLLLGLSMHSKGIEFGDWNNSNKENKRRETAPLSKTRARQVRHGATYQLIVSLRNRDWFGGYYYNDMFLRTDLCYGQLARFKGKVRAKGDPKGRKN